MGHSTAVLRRTMSRRPDSPCRPFGSLRTGAMKPAREACRAASKILSEFNYLRLGGTAVFITALSVLTIYLTY